MKNKRSMIIVIAMVLLLAVVLGMGGTTFAKYITKADDVSESATVAKWGYVVTTDAADLFSDEYAYDNTAATSIVSDGAAAVTVLAASDTVAPGTTGSMKVVIQGQAEVAANIDVQVSNEAVVKLTSYKDAEDQTVNANYIPVKWTLVDGTTKVDGGTLEEVAAYLEGLSGNVAAGVEVDHDITITWEWAFHDTDTTDLYDTILGDTVATEGSVLAGVSDVVATTTLGFDLTVKVTQIQENVTLPVAP